MRLIVRSGIGFLCCLWMFQPTHAQSTPAQSNVDEQCQGSTVDSQGPETATAARAFLAELQGAVKADDKTRIARMVSYPMNFIQGTKRVHIRDKQTFLARYDTIFTEHVRNAILTQSSHCLFGNANGEMVGHGEVWFTELGGGSVKIITVNTSSGM